jgi:phosphatidylglycerophosphatase A
MRARPRASLAMSVATLCGAGLARHAPGSWGSAVVLPFVLLGPAVCLLLAGVMTIAAFWAAARVLYDEKEDPAWFVTDEGAGMLLALAGLQAASLPGVLLAFLLFRAFDIVKPWPVSWADRQPGATGVIVDDLIAGLMAALILLGFQAAFPGVLV